MATIGREGCTGVQAVFDAKNSSARFFVQIPGTAAKMSHPHVVTVIDAGEDEGHPFIVLEYVEGETLKDRIRRCGPLPRSRPVRPR